MKYTRLKLFAAGLAIASCSVNEINGDLVNKDTNTIYASTEAETKTTLDENEDGVYKVTWTAGDQIVLIDERGYTATYATEDGGESRAKFTLKKSHEELEFDNGVLAGYPVKNIYLNSSDPEIPVFISIPSTQEYNGTSFADNVMPMISDVTTGINLKFKNAAGVIRFMISATEEINVKSLVVKSGVENISGECGYIPETQNYFFDDSLQSEKSVTLSCENSVKVGKEAKAFFIVVPHQTYTDLEVIVKTDDGYEKSFEMKSEKTLTVKRSSVATIPLHVDGLKKSDDSADVQFAPHSVKWSYKYFDRGYEYSRYFNTEDTEQLQEWETDNEGVSLHFNYPEIKVASSRVEISMLTDTIPDSDVHQIDFRINPSDDRFEIRAYGPDGNEIKYKADGWTPFLDESNYIVLNALTSKIAKLIEVNLPFMDFPVTYKASKYVVNEDNKMKYSIAFDIILGATPEDKVIDLGTFTIPYTQAHVNKIPVTPITKAVAADAEAFADLPAHKIHYFDETVGPWNDTWTRVSWNMKAPGYLEMRSTEGYNTIAYRVNPATDKIEEDAYLEIPQTAEYDTTYDLEEAWTFYGIKYTFKAQVNCQRPVYKLVPNPKFVKNGVVELTGRVVYPLYADGKYNGVGDNEYDNISDEYTLDKINLREYVNVEGMSTMDKLYNELQISYKIKETRSTASGYTAPLGLSFVKDADPAVLSTSQWPYNAYYDGDDNYVENVDPVMLYWDSVDQYPDNSNPHETINEVSVEYQLLSHDGLVEFGDPLTIKLIVPELLKLEVTKTLTEPWKHNDVVTATNIYKALKITDIKTGAQVSNPEATKLGDFFNYSYIDTHKDKITKVGVRNVYGIEMVPQTAKIKIYLKSGIELKSTDYEFYEKDVDIDNDGNPEHFAGDIKLAGNSGNLTDNVIIEIPVEMYHMYQSDHSHTAIVKVEFTN